MLYLRSKSGMDISSSKSRDPVSILWLELWAVFFNQPFSESDCWHKLKYILIERIRGPANTVHNFFDAMEYEEDFEDLATVETKEQLGE